MARRVIHEPDVRLWLSILLRFAIREEAISVPGRLELLELTRLFELGEPVADPLVEWSKKYIPSAEWKVVKNRVYVGLHAQRKNH